MNRLSNLPPGVTDADIERASGYLNDGERNCSRCTAVCHESALSDCPDCDDKDLCEHCIEAHICLVETNHPVLEAAGTFAAWLILKAKATLQHLAALVALLVCLAGACAWMAWWG